MNGLFPIIRRVRRPLVATSDPAVSPAPPAPVVVAAVVLAEASPEAAADAKPKRPLPREKTQLA